MQKMQVWETVVGTVREDFPWGDIILRETQISTKWFIITGFIVTAYISLHAFKAKSIYMGYLFYSLQQYFERELT